VSPPVPRYAVAIIFSTLVGRPTVRRLIELSSGQGSMPIPALASPGPGAAGAPPAELISTVQRAKRNGIFLTVLTVAIVFLMVVKPQFGI
jgi:hypothetical protein